MKISRKLYLKDKIKVYHSTLADRILLGFGGIAFPIMALFVIIMGGYENKEELYMMIATLCGILIFEVCIFYTVYNTYILLDLHQEKLIVRDYPGFSKKEFDLQNIRKIVISEDSYSNETFVIEIVGPIYTHQIHSWTWGRAGQPITETKTMKRQRLEEFASKCNELIMEYNSVHH